MSEVIGFPLHSVLLLESIENNPIHESIPKHTSFVKFWLKVLLSPFRPLGFPFSFPLCAVSSLLPSWRLSLSPGRNFPRQLSSGYKAPQEFFPGSAMRNVSLQCENPGFYLFTEKHPFPAINKYARIYL